MSASDSYNLVVIGGGMAGLPIAIRGAREGQQTALVEQDLLGGTCLNWGLMSLPRTTGALLLAIEEDSSMNKGSHPPWAQPFQDVS